MKHPASSQPDEPWQDEPSQPTLSRRQWPPDLDEDDSFPGYEQPSISSAVTRPLAAFSAPATGIIPTPPPKSQRRLARIAAPLVALALLAGIVVVLRLPTSAAQPPTISQPSVSTDATNQSGSGSDIQAYIVGAVVHPGVYALHPNDRVDQLLADAGGPLPDADLVRVNLAAHVTDGEEVFVPRVGEPLPGGLDGGGPGKVNINTASADDMHTLLGISLTTANKIIAYREAHGPYTAITQLLNVMSRTTYDKIKDYITV